MVLTSDHGESLGEHDYYFDHGEDLFDPCLRIPLVVVAPGRAAGAAERGVRLDPRPRAHVLDAVKVSYPPDLAGDEPAAASWRARPLPRRDRLFAQNDRNLTATFDERFKLVATPGGRGRALRPLRPREAIPGETQDVSKQRPDELRALAARARAVPGAVRSGVGADAPRFSRAVPARGG